MNCVKTVLNSLCVPTIQALPERSGHQQPEGFGTPVFELEQGLRDKDTVIPEKGKVYYPKLFEHHTGKTKSLSWVLVQ